MMKEAGPVCCNCLFWDGHGAGGFGDCRINPPTIVDFFVKQAEVDYKFEDKGASLTNATSWPITEKYDWCGKFAADTRPE